MKKNTTENAFRTYIIAASNNLGDRPNSNLDDVNWAVRENILSRLRARSIFVHV
jgi:hypothetical protein